MIQVIDIHDLKPGDHIAGFGKMVRKVTWTNDFPFVEFEDGSTWDASQEKTVSVVRPVEPYTERYQARLDEALAFVKQAALTGEEATANRWSRIAADIQAELSMGHPIECVGQCPKCKASALSFGDMVNDWFYPFVCDVCGATGREYYKVEYMHTVLTNQVEIERYVTTKTRRLTLEACFRGYCENVPEEMIQKEFERFVQFLEAHDHIGPDDVQWWFEGEQAQASDEFNKVIKGGEDE